MKLKQAETLEEISSLLKLGFQRGAVTNNFQREDDYRRALSGNGLLLGRWENGFAFFQKRRGASQMRFTLLPGEAPGRRPILPAETVLCEIPLRPGDEGCQRAVRFWEDQGFEPVLERVRLKRDPDAPPPPVARRFFISRAEAQDAAAVTAFLREQFDPLTGCLPEEDELGPVFCLREGDRIAGALHVGGTPARREIRHLAVEEELRGTGAAQALLGTYLMECPARDHLVWTGKENAAALRFYEKSGYEPDGWTSVVLCKEERNAL